MSGSVRPGPAEKNSTWRGGSFLVGLIVLLSLLSWVLGDFLNVSGAWGRLSLLIFFGFLLSLPHGLAVVRGRHRPESPAEPMPVVREVRSDSGSTVVVFPAAPADAPGASVKSKELGTLWYVAYVVLWKAPVVVGDLVLSGVWSLLGRVPMERLSSPYGMSQAPSVDDLERAAREPRRSDKF